MGIQHTGWREGDSHFPGGEKTTPRSSVIAITSNDGGSHRPKHPSGSLRHAGHANKNALPLAGGTVFFANLCAKINA